MVGDYISRDAAIKEMSHMMHECFPEAVEELDAVITTLKEIPAADVVECKHARWKGAGLGDYYCSLCNETYSIGAERVKNWNNCPNCGAKMDGGQDDV